MLAVRNFLLWQNYVCCDKIFLLQQNLLRQIFVPTNMCLLWQQTCVCCDKNMFVTTKRLSQQAYFCRDKRPVLLWQTRVCRNKSFVATKMILVAAPGNDKSIPIDNNRIVFGDANKWTYTRLYFTAHILFFSMTMATAPDRTTCATSLWPGRCLWVSCFYLTDLIRLLCGWGRESRERPLKKMVGFGFGISALSSRAKNLQGILEWTRRVCVYENESLTKLRMWCGVLGMDFRGFHTVVLCQLHSCVCKALT